MSYEEVIEEALVNYMRKVLKGDIEHIVNNYLVFAGFCCGIFIFLKLIIYIFLFSLVKHYFCTWFGTLF